MKLTTLTAALLLSTTACGQVVEPGDSDLESNHGAEATDIEMPEEPGTTMVPSPILLEAPRAATTPYNLFAMSFANEAAIVNVIEQAASADIVEQRLVTKTAEEIQLVIELTPPTGTYARTLVSDTVRMGTRTDHVLCESNNVATFDPACETVVPKSREIPNTGAIAQATYKLWVLDESTGQALTSCVKAGLNRIECVLPTVASASYRIMASGQGFKDLWDGTNGFGRHSLASMWFAGAFGAPEYQCWDWASTSTGFYCATRYEFARFTAVDRARLEFDPITLRVTANGSVATMASPALVWDAGNDDVPGAY